MDPTTFAIASSPLEKMTKVLEGITNETIPAIAGVFASNARQLYYTEHKGVFWLSRGLEDALSTMFTVINDPKVNKTNLGEVEYYVRYLASETGHTCGMHIVAVHRMQSLFGSRYEVREAVFAPNDAGEVHFRSLSNYDNVMEHLTDQKKIAGITFNSSSWLKNQHIWLHARTPSK